MDEEILTLCQAHQVKVVKVKVKVKITVRVCTFDTPCRCLIFTNLFVAMLES